MSPRRPLHHPDAPMRRIVQWLGPSATRVLLECGHEAASQAARETRCVACGEAQSSKRRRKRKTTKKKGEAAGV